MRLHQIWSLSGSGLLSGSSLTAYMRTVNMHAHQLPRVQCMLCARTVHAVHVCTLDDFRNRRDVACHGGSEVEMFAEYLHSGHVCGVRLARDR